MRFINIYNLFAGKPVSDVKNITIGLQDDTDLAFSTTIIAYPKPQYVLLAEDGIISHGIEHHMTVNSMNNFTIRMNKTDVNQHDYGTYHLYINNTFGETIVQIFVIPQSKTIFSLLLFFFLCMINFAFN